MSAVVLSARSLSVAYASPGGARQVLADVDLDLSENRIIGLAGESGCGKSTLALALAGYRPPGLQVIGGSVTLRGALISGASRRQLRRWWGCRIAYLPQDTSTALNPALRVGHQLSEVFRLHKGMGRAAALGAGIEMLERVGIPDPERAAHRYPHEFSGGQQQRIAIAIALGPGPEVIILDEPTTGLDVTVQARINALIVELIRAEGMAALYVSHNLSLLAVLCDELRILYAGQMVESGQAGDVYFDAEHPYSRDLLAAVPGVFDEKPVRGIEGTPPSTVVLAACAFGARCRSHQPRCDVTVPLVERPGGRLVRCVRVGEDLDPEERPLAEDAAGPPGCVGAAPTTLLSVEGLGVTYSHAGRSTTALEHLSFRLAGGEVLGVVGESGSGKSTLLRTMAGLLAPRSGEMSFREVAVPWPAERRPTELRREIQIVFQNPDASLNPRQTIGAILDHPLRKFRPDMDSSKRRARVEVVLAQLRLSDDLLGRYPSEISGGQRQRVALARALVAEPAVVLCDEITSALDVSVQATILELLNDLRRQEGLAMVFVTHDLGVLRAIADRAIVLESGQVREQGPVTQLLRNPSDPYTASLVASIPDPLSALGVGGSPGNGQPSPR